MNNGISIYSESLALLTDLYQLTMAYGYFKTGTHEKNAVFNLFFRKSPFNGDYAIAAGLDYAIEIMKNFKFQPSDIGYLSKLTGNDGQHLFDLDFLMYLMNMEFSCTVDAIPEGTVVFPHEPLIRISGPIIQCQLLETILLNVVNFQTLIATKASRVCEAADGGPVLEFGLRRAQGIDGALAASRAAFIGGCSATSNVLAGKLFGIPVKGTHAHSWVMSFDTEKEAFECYADAMPNNCTFLVDTYNTIDGVKTAIEVANKKNIPLAGIRLDSGDLAKLSIAARAMLDEAGFTSTKIVASNDLDEYEIGKLKANGARIDIWGVGTNLVTAYDQPALGGVYKLAAIENDNKWDYKVKLSEQEIKVSNPGILQVRRFYNIWNNMIGDMLFNTENHPSNVMKSFGTNQFIQFNAGNSYKDLLVPIFVAGKCVYNSPSLSEIANNTKENLLQFLARKSYSVGLEKSLVTLKENLINKLRSKA